MNKRKSTDARTPASPRTLEQALAAGGRGALLASHCLLVEQVLSLAVVVVELWDEHNRLRETLGLPRAPLPVAGSLACTAERQPVDLQKR